MSAKPTEAKRVLVALSGGPNSFVTAALLKNQGFEVEGIHLKIAPRVGESGCAFEATCRVDSNEALAREFCKKVNIPFETLDVSDEFEDRVIDYVVHEFAQCRLPEPCGPCNTQIKIRGLLAHAEAKGFDFVATGHFAVVEREEMANHFRLRRAVDADRDHSYFLAGLTQSQLSRLMFPLGTLKGEMIRKLAIQLDIEPPAQQLRRRSCFIDSASRDAFLEERIPPDLRFSGNTRTLKGEVIGQHDGLYRFPLRSQKNLRLNIKEDREKYFVIGYEKRHDVLIVGDTSELNTEKIMVSGLEWLQAIEGIRSLRCVARTHPLGADADCMVTVFENRVAHVYFAQTQPDVTPGQTIVFYKEDEVLGSGRIDRLTVAAV